MQSTTSHGGATCNRATHRRSRASQHGQVTGAPAHRKLAIWGWVAFLVVAIFVGQSIAPNELKGADKYAGESAKAEKTLEEAFPQPAGEMVLVHSGKRTSNDASLPGGALTDVSEPRARSVKDVKNVQDPYDHGGDLISKDRHSVLVTLDIKGDSEKAVDKIDPIVRPGRGRAAGAPRHPHRVVRHQRRQGAGGRLHEGPARRPGCSRIPITLRDPADRLRLADRGRRAAAAGAVGSAARRWAWSSIPSQLFPIDEGASEVILLIGLAVGVDYSLFYMRREREERAAGHDPQTALQRAAATSGRAVLVSGLTVMVAMAGMFFSGDKGFVGLGLGAMMVVGVAMVGSLTVLPAMIAWLGDRVEKGRLPLPAAPQRAAASASPAMWTAIIDRVLRRPVRLAVAATALLLVLAAPGRRHEDHVDGARPTCRRTSR